MPKKGFSARPGKSRTLKRESVVAAITDYISAALPALPVLHRRPAQREKLVYLFARFFCFLIRQFDTPTTFPIETPFSPALIMKSATSARKIAKPKRGRWPSNTRYLPVRGWSVSLGGRTIVQSSPLFRKTFFISPASRTTSGKKRRPTRFVGGMIESLNRKAVDSTTTRRTPARCGR
jgi:hypothetical protein